jgi:ankyrin repeat protein
MSDKAIHAAQYGDYRSLVSSIESSNLSVDTVDDENCSLLHWAAINKRNEILDYLIDRNANVNIVGGINGEIPLQWAIRHPKNSKVIMSFIQKGADIMHKSVYGFDALFIAVQEGRTNVAFILLNCGADANTRDAFGDTPLYWLLKNENAIDRSNLIRLLLRYNASVVHVDKGQYNAFHLMLITSNHSSGSDPNSIDLDSALLAYTAAHARKEIDTLLNTKNGDGRTPRQV